MSSYERMRLDSQLKYLQFKDIILAKIAKVASGNDSHYVVRMIIFDEMIKS